MGSAQTPAAKSGRPVSTPGGVRSTNLALLMGMLTLMQWSCCEIPDDPMFNDLPPYRVVDSNRSTIQKALDYLHYTQVTTELEEVLEGRDWAGNWPQYLYPAGLPSLAFRDVSSFVPSFIHHSLSVVTEDTRAALELTESDVDTARSMRREAATFMHRFRRGKNWPDAGTVGFWPEAYHALPQCHRLASIAESLVGGDNFHGDRAPLNIWLFPPEYQVPADADCSATVHENFLTCHEIDGGPPLPADLEQMFTRWRDDGAESMRIRFDWMVQPSGAFLTWLADRPQGKLRTPQDVDLVVNANVLFFLGRYGRRDAEGVDAAIDLINSAVLANRHHEITQVSSYYPDSFVFHYAVSRAYAHGGLDELAPAVNHLADEIELSSIQQSGEAHWNRGFPHLNTAFALLTLLNAGRHDLVTEAVIYLERRQNADTGAWAEGPFFSGTSAAGFTVEWGSPAFTTAIVLEALARAKLEVAPE